MRRISLGTLGESKFGQKFAKSNVSVCQKVNASSTGKRPDSQERWGLRQMESPRVIG